MSAPRDLDRLLQSYLSEGPQELPDTSFDAVRDRMEQTRQRTSIGLWRTAGMNRYLKVGLAAAAVALVAVIGIGLAGPDRGVSHPSPTPPSETESPTAAESPTSSILPVRGLPGGGPGARAGDYGWRGHPGGSIGWLHHVIGEGETLRQTQIVFAVKDDCFATGEGLAPRALKIAGYDALQVEPYPEQYLEGIYLNHTMAADIPISAYALSIDGFTLCVYTAWERNSTPADLDALRQVLESIRGQAVGEDSLRILFTLDAGWDTG